MPLTPRVGSLNESPTIEDNPTNVVATLDMLLEEIEAEIEFENRVGARNFEDRDYERAKDTLERVAQIINLRDKAVALRREWQSLFGREMDVDDDGTEIHNDRRNLGRLQRGLRTREEVYYRPILEALQALGGSAQVSEILDCVFQKMRGILQEVDYEPLASNPEMPRWKKTAQWARYTMVKRGLLRSNSPRGVWEITDSGMQYLQR